MVMEHKCAMKKKLIFKSIIILLMLLQYYSVYSQDVSLTFSIKKVKAEHYSPIACDDDSIPFLFVEYENGSDSSIYLHRIGKTTEDDFPLLPIIGIYSFLTNAPNLYELAIASKGKNRGQKYSVQIRSDFIVMTENHHFETEWIINVYRFLASIRTSIIGNSTSYTDCYCWEEKDFSQESICYYEKHKDDWGFSLPIDSIMMLERYRKNLVFLPPHSKVVHRYNLIGFWYVGGDYLFKLPEEYWPTQSVYLKGSTKTIPLPHIIDGYALYQGNIKTNEVILKE